MSAKRIYNLKKDDPDERDLEIDYNVVPYKVLVSNIKRVYISHNTHLPRLPQLSVKQEIKCGDTYKV
jgi:hypothetical protein